MDVSVMVPCVLLLGLRSILSRVRLMAWWETLGLASAKVVLAGREVHDNEYRERS
jgi:hypothetical protein